MSSKTILCKPNIYSEIYSTIGRESKFRSSKDHHSFILFTFCLHNPTMLLKKAASKATLIFVHIFITRNGNPRANIYLCQQKLFLSVVHILIKQGTKKC